MKKELEILEKIYGSKDAAANALGISPRHFYRLLKGQTAHKSLMKFIRYLAIPHMED